MNIWKCTLSQSNPNFYVQLEMFDKKKIHYKNVINIQHNKNRVIDILSDNDYSIDVVFLRMRGIRDTGSKCNRKYTCVCLAAFWFPTEPG